MTPEADCILQKAEKHLERGYVMLGVGLNDDAGRAAYLAAFHAAQAVIFERTGKVVKTHRGVQSEFLRLTKDDPGFTPDQRIFFRKLITSRPLPITISALERSFQQKRPPQFSKEGAGLLMLSATY
ncbi:MAG: HEPN domain-containing protein [Bryobacteraceae bacterium]